MSNDRRILGIRPTNVAKTFKPGVSLSRATKRLEAAMLNQFDGSEELAEFALNTLAENIENGNEVAFIYTEGRKTRIKRYIFAADEGKKGGEK